MPLEEGSSRHERPGLSAPGARDNLDITLHGAHGCGLIAVERELQVDTPVLHKARPNRRVLAGREQVRIRIPRRIPGGAQEIGLERQRDLLQQRLSAWALGRATFLLLSSGFLAALPLLHLPATSFHDQLRKLVAQTWRPESHSLSHVVLPSGELQGVQGCCASDGRRQHGQVVILLLLKVHRVPAADEFVNKLSNGVVESRIDDVSFPPPASHHASLIDRPNTNTHLHPGCPSSRRCAAVRQRGVLSIAKLSTEQCRYYVGTAQGRVDAAQSLGGAEDYYGESGRAPSAWVGAGARRLGLSGTVSDEGLRRAFAGEHPLRGDLLRARRGPQRNAAIDLTFSAPKSVSLLFGVGDPRVEATVRGAHDDAVTAALGYLERRAVRVRRGRNGVQVLRGEGFVAATFRHRASRAGDPQLHTHAVVANMALGPDGRWTALDARPIYAHAMAAGCLYQAVLRARLTAELGVTWAPVRDGLAELDGISPKVLRSFSRRRVEIEAEVARHGTSGPAATEAAALATRRRKDPRVDAQSLRCDWTRRAAGLGFDPTTVVGRRRARL